MVMNETIMDVNEDELQLITVEELLPLNGPSAVSLFGNGSTAPPPRLNSGLNLCSASMKCLCICGLLLSRFGWHPCLMEMRDVFCMRVYTHQRCQGRK